MGWEGSVSPWSVGRRPRDVWTDRSIQSSGSGFDRSHANPLLPLAAASHGPDPNVKVSNRAGDDTHPPDADAATAVASYPLPKSSLACTHVDRPTHHSVCVCLPLLGWVGGGSTLLDAKTRPRLGDTGAVSCDSGPRETTRRGRGALLVASRLSLCVCRRAKRVDCVCVRVFGSGSKRMWTGAKRRRLTTTTMRERGVLCRLLQRPFGLHGTNQKTEMRWHFAFAGTTGGRAWQSLRWPRFSPLESIHRNSHNLPTGALIHPFIKHQARRPRCCRPPGLITSARSSSSTRLTPRSACLLLP